MAVVIGELGQKDGGGNVTDKLTGEDADKQGAFAKQEGKQIPYCVKPRHIACENKEANKGEKQSVVYLAQGFAVKKKGSCENDRGAEKVGDHAEYDGDREGKQHQINGGAALWQSKLSCFMKLDRFALDGHAAREDHHGCREKERKHNGHKFQIADLVFGIYVKILRIAEGGQHTAEIGGDVLQDEDERHLGFLACCGKNVIAEGQEGNKRHIVCDQHGADKGDENKRHHRGAKISRRVNNAPRKNGKESNILESADHRKGTEETRQRLEIKVFEIVAVRLDQKAGEESQGRRDHQHGVALYKSFNRRHKNLSEIFNLYSILPKQKMSRALLEFLWKSQQKRYQRGRNQKGGCHAGPKSDREMRTPGSS